jgi:hypothetical protein
MLVPWHTRELCLLDNLAERHGRELSKTGRLNIIEFVFLAVAVWAPAVGNL